MQPPRVSRASDVVQRSIPTLRSALSYVSTYLLDYVSFSARLAVPFSCFHRFDRHPVPPRLITRARVARASRACAQDMRSRGNLTAGGHTRKSNATVDRSTAISPFQEPTGGKIEKSTTFGKFVKYQRIPGDRFTELVAGATINTGATVEKCSTTNRIFS